jgi:hypothetical protein
VALIHSMRLSLMKGAYADLSSTAWQEIGVKPAFGLSGIPQHSTRLFLPLGAKPSEHIPFAGVACTGPPLGTPEPSLEAELSLF